MSKKMRSTKGLRMGGRALRVGGALVALSLIAAACGSTSPTSSTSTSAPLATGKPIKGGVASYALPIGQDFSWIFPLENETNYEGWDGNVESGLWRPLYFAGAGGKTGVNYKLSIANPPVYSDGDTEVTVTLKHGWKWSDGAPVTTSDVRFFFELEAAGVKLGDYAPYVPGEMPDDIKSVTYNGPYSFTIHLSRSYNPEWFTGNQLSWIYPLPRQVWDKTCATCAVGHNAATSAGATKVYNYLYKQSSDLSTYATNPLWKVVDGPWTLKSFSATTYHTVLSANPAYTGPGKPHLAGYSIYSFESDTAEVDAVRSGIVDFGSLPYSDFGEKTYLASHGFQVAPWEDFYNQVIEFGYTGPWKNLVSQLYIRQAMQHLVNEKLYISQTLHGYGVADYGVAPDDPTSDMVATALLSDPYPYSITAARALLKAHGWVKGADGIDACERPGDGSNECGPGIPKGKKLSIEFTYETEAPSFLAQVDAFVTAAAKAGINVRLDGQSETAMFSDVGVCPSAGPCNWGMAGYAGFMWDFGQSEIVPSGGNEFGKGNFFGGGYNSNEADALIAAAHEKPGLAPLDADETYLSKQVAALWWPLEDYEIVVAKDDLGGWYPLNPYANYQPSTWYFTKS